MEALFLALRREFYVWLLAIQLSPIGLRKGACPSSSICLQESRTTTSRLCFEGLDASVSHNLELGMQRWHAKFLRKESGGDWARDTIPTFTKSFSISATVAFDHLPFTAEQNHRNIPNDLLIG